MSKFSNIISVIVIFFISLNIYGVDLPTWVTEPKTEEERFLAAMLSSNAGDKNWVFCYRCAFGRVDIDSKINEKNCKKVYKVWSESDLDLIKKSCH